MKIGLPRALLYYYYYPFWKTLFEELNCEIVVSDETNARIIAEGSKVTVQEICVPIKIFNGHILNLLEKNVDYIFVPQFISMGMEWYCPKFIGITELSKYSIDSLKEKILTIEITSDDDILNNISNYLPLCEVLHVTKKQLKAALTKSEKSFKAFRRLCSSGYSALEAFDILSGKKADTKLEKPRHDSEITVGLMGYVYNMYDGFVSMNAIQKLYEMNVKTITFDMLDENLIAYKKTKNKMPYWVFARKIYNAAKYLINHQKVDGIIHITAFGCGPDSIIGKMMELDCEEKNIPFMTLRVDEHTGENHIQTRLEAFIDMLKISKSKGEVEIK